MSETIETTAAAISVDDKVFFPGRKQPVEVIAAWPTLDKKIEIAGWNRGMVALIVSADTVVQVIQ